jgi:hypothetical protein
VRASALMMEAVRASETSQKVLIFMNTALSLFWTYNHLSQSM